MPQGIKVSRETQTAAPRRDDRRPQTAALVDLSPRGVQAQALAQLMRAGPAAMAQTAQLRRAFGPVGQDMTLSAGAVAQLQVSTKSSAHGEKASGSAKHLRQEVAETIKGKARGEHKDDIAALETSIESREAEQAEFKPGDAVYAKHAARITLEKAQLALLQSSLAKLPTRAPKAKAVTNASGWTTV